MPIQRFEGVEPLHGFGLIGVSMDSIDAVHTINGVRHLIWIILQIQILSCDLPQQQQPFFRQLHDIAQPNQPAIQTFSENYRKIADEYDGDRFLMGEADGDKGRAMEVSKTFTDMTATRDL